MISQITVSHNCIFVHVSGLCIILFNKGKSVNMNIDFLVRSHNYMSFITVLFQSLLIPSHWHF